MLQKFYEPGLLIAGGAALLGQGVNAYSQGRMNRANRQFAQEQADVSNQRNIANWRMQNEYNQQMWDKQNQYDDTIWNRQNAYNEAKWDKENAYNSPMAQMERYKEAGLNPNLIYGQSNMGGSISTANLDSGNMRGSDIPGAQKAEYQGRAPSFDIQGGINSVAALRESAARTDNLRKLNTVYEQDAALRAAQTAGTITGTAKTAQELKLGSALFQTSVDAAAASLRKTQIETDISLNQDERHGALTKSNLKEAAERILQMRGQRMNMELERKLKELDIELRQGEVDWRRMGINKDDNLGFRILGKILNRGEQYMNFKIP